MREVIFKKSYLKTYQDMRFEYHVLICQKIILNITETETETETETKTETERAKERGRRRKTLVLMS